MTDIEKYLICLKSTFRDEKFPMGTRTFGVY
jgi:hypothetical protein